MPVREKQQGGQGRQEPGLAPIPENQLEKGVEQNNSHQGKTQSAQDRSEFNEAGVVVPQGQNRVNTQQKGIDVRAEKPFHCTNTCQKAGVLYSKIIPLSQVKHFWEWII
jgi:hypothetical protein